MKSSSQTSSATPSCATPGTYAEQEKAILRQQARRSLLSFTVFTKSDFQPSWHHRRLCRFVDDFLVDASARIAIVNMPPQHGKSEIISRRLPAYLFGHDPDLPLIACSHTSGLAGDMNRDVQRIMDDPRYLKLFGGTRLSGEQSREEGSYQKNSEIFEIVGRVGSYRAAGVGGNIVGRGFGVGIIDDPHKSREEAESPVIRERIWKWFTGDFLTRRRPGWKLFVVQTRYNREDLTGRIEQMAKEDPVQFAVRKLVFKGLCEEESVGDPRKPGEALWPARYPVADLETIRKADPWAWSALYQQNPRPEGGVEWPDDYFGPYIWFDEFPTDILLRVLSLDPSKGKSDKVGDYSAFIDLALDKQGTLWADADLAQGRPATRNANDPGPSIVSDGLDLYVATRPQAFVIEINGFQELLAPEFARQALERKLFSVPFYGITNTLPKPTRIRTCGPYLARRELRVRNTPGGRLLVQQLRDFPVGEHDDGPDALEQAIRTMRFLLGEKSNLGNPVVLRV